MKKKYRREGAITTSEGEHQKSQRSGDISENQKAPAYEDEVDCFGINQ